MRACVMHREGCSLSRVRGLCRKVLRIYIFGRKLIYYVHVCVSVCVYMYVSGCVCLSVSVCMLLPCVCACVCYVCVYVFVMSVCVQVRTHIEHSLHMLGMLTSGQSV